MYRHVVGYVCMFVTLSDAYVFIHKIKWTVPGYSDMSNSSCSAVITKMRKAWPFFRIPIWIIKINIETDASEPIQHVAKRTPLKTLRCPLVP